MLTTTLYAFNMRNPNVTTCFAGREEKKKEYLKLIKSIEELSRFFNEKAPIEIYQLNMPTASQGLSLSLFVKNIVPVTRVIGQAIKSGSAFNDFDQTIHAHHYPSSTAVIQAMENSRKGKDVPIQDSSIGKYRYRSSFVERKLTSGEQRVWKQEFSIYLPERKLILGGTVIQPARNAF